MTQEPSAAMEAFVRGARLFDAGAFFEAHEAWEAQWRAETGEGARRFFQGLIQVAAGFHKCFVARDRLSAARLLARGLAKLDACDARCVEAGIAAWREAVRTCIGGVERGELGRGQVPRLRAPSADATQ